MDLSKSRKTESLVAEDYSDDDRTSSGRFSASGKVSLSGSQYNFSISPHLKEAHRAIQRGNFSRAESSASHRGRDSNQSGTFSPSQSAVMVPTYPSPTGSTSTAAHRNSGTPSGPPSAAASPMSRGTRAPSQMQGSGTYSHEFSQYVNEEIQLLFTTVVETIHHVTPKRSEAHKKKLVLPEPSVYGVENRTQEEQEIYVRKCLSVFTKALHTLIKSILPNPTVKNTARTIIEQLEAPQARVEEERQQLIKLTNDVQGKISTEIEH